MGKFLFDAGLNLGDKAWRVAGRNAPGAPGMRVITPDPAINDLCADVFKRVVEQITFPFGYRFRSRWLRASMDSSAAQSTESSMASLLLRHWDPTLAREILRVFFFNRTIEGRMPLVVKPFSVSHFPAYPFILYSLFKYNEITSDTEGTHELYLKYLKFSDWLVVNHKGEGGFYHHNDERWFRNDFLVRPLVETEPRAASEWNQVLSLGLNCMMVYQYRLMSRSAIVSGEHRDGRKFDNHAKKLAKFISDKFWNEKQGFYFDFVGRDMAGKPTSVGFLPLIAEAATREQAERMLQLLPATADTLCGNLAERRRNSLLLFMLIEGLNKYGLHSQAGEIAHRFAAAAAALPDAPEHFLARIIAVHCLLEYTVGYCDLGGDRMVMFPRLPGAWDGRRINIENQSRGIAVEMMSSGGRVVYTITHSGDKTASMTLNNMTYKNVFLKETTGEDTRPATAEDAPDKQVD